MVFKRDVETSHHIIFGDAAKSSLSDNSIDLMVTSPPYPMISLWDTLFKRSDRRIKDNLDNHEGWKAFELMHLQLGLVWNRIERAMKPGSILAINIGDATRTLNKQFNLYPNHVSITQQFLQMGYNILPMIIWYKPNNSPTKYMGSGMLPVGAYTTYETEYILIFRKPPRRTFSREDKQIRLRSAFFWEERNIWFSNIWSSLVGVKQKLGKEAARSRSAAYPLELVNRLICMYSIQGDTVLDPFSGTGTTSLGAMINGRSSVGIELDTTLNKSIETQFSQIKTMNKEYVDQRIKDHQEFISAEKHKGKVFTYRSKHYEFDVKSKQEVDIQFPLITEVNQNDLHYQIKYQF